MPTVRYQIRNEYGLADPEVYRAGDKDDPEALLEGVAMAGLVGVLRQLGDLAEFASEVFHNLHEEVMAISSRGHGLMLRVLQLEAEFPSIEKAILSETDHSHLAYSAGIDWHAYLRAEQNLFSQGDMPRFILDSYEECRGPPRLFMLDKFDVAGAGACLTRYSNPSFFKSASAFSEMMEEAQREKRTRKPKKGSPWRSGQTTGSFFMPIIDHLQFTASEPVTGKFPVRLVKLKHRKLGISDISNRKSYMEGFLKEESFDHNDSKSSLCGCPNNKIIDGTPDVQEFLICGPTDSLLVRKEFSSQSHNEVTGKVQNLEREHTEFSKTNSISPCVSPKLYPKSQNVKEEMLVGLGNEMDAHALDSSSDEIDTTSPSLQLAVQNNSLPVSGFLTDDDRDSYRSDDIESELESYVDALNTMECEMETDSESRAKTDPSQGTDPNIHGQAELLPLSSISAIFGSSDTLVTSENVKDGMPSLSQSTILYNLSDQQLKERTVIEETSSLEFQHDEKGNLERTSEDMSLVPSACLISNETCCQKQPNATMVVPINKEAFTSYCITDSDLKLQPIIDEVQTLAAHSEEAIAGSKKNKPEIDEHIESSFRIWKTNHIVVFPTCEECPDIPTDILEEINAIEYSEDRSSLNITKKSYMLSAFSETEDGIPEKAPSESSKDLSNLLDNGSEKPLDVSDSDKNDYISESSLPIIPVGSSVLESQVTSNDSEIDMQSEDLTMKVSPNMEAEVEERKQLNAGLLFPAESHKLPSVENINNLSHISPQTSESFNDVIAYISDERGSLYESRNNSVIGQLSGYTEHKRSNDLANSLEMPQPPRIQAESSLVDVCSICVKDAFHDPVENDNEVYSFENLSPKSSSFSLEIVSSVLQSRNLAAEMGNISVTKEEFEHAQLLSSSGNIDILGRDALIFPTIPCDTEHFPDVDEPQESSNGVMLNPLPSSCREHPDANQLHCDISQLMETNGEEIVHDELKCANGSAKLSGQHELLLLGENKNNSFTENCIPKDSINEDVLNMLESAEVATCDVLLQDDLLLEDDTLHQPYPTVEEPAITRDSTSLQSESKSYLLFTENKEIEMFYHSVSKSQSSALELSDSSEAKLVDVKEDNLCSGENEQDSDSRSVNVITEDDTDVNVLYPLKSSSACNFDVQFQEDPVSGNAVLSMPKPVTEELNDAKSDSKFSTVTQVRTDGQILHLVESSNLYSFDVQIQEDSIEDASLNQNKPEIQEPAVENDLTTSKFESKLLAPLCDNVGTVSSSPLQGLDLSNCIHADHGDIYMETSLISSIEAEKHSDSDPSMQCSHVDAERTEEVPSEKASVFQAVDEPSIAPIYRVLENFEPSYLHFDEVSSDEPASSQHNLEHDVLLLEPEPETSLNLGWKNDLNMLSSNICENEQKETNISVSFHGVAKQPWNSMASEALASGPLLADFVIPSPTIGSQETLKAYPGETISSLPIQKGIEETPPLPPLPPMQWRMGSSMHINPLPASEERTNQHAGPFLSPVAFEESFQNASSCTDGQLTGSLKLSEFLVVPLEHQRQQLEIDSSGFSLLAPAEEDGMHSHSDITMDGENPLTMAPLLRNVTPQHPDHLAEGNPQVKEERRPNLVKLLPGLELERSLEAPTIDIRASPPFSSFMLMPAAADGLYQYGYRDYRVHEAENMHYHKLPAPFPVAVQSIPPYAYHMFLREGNSSTMYDIMLNDMEGDKPNEKYHSILSRPRDPLIEAVATHDKSTLRKVSELDRSLPKPKEDETNHLLEQIKTKSLNLKPATSKANMVKVPSTNLKVAAMLEKANAIRQACVGSDEDDDDSWNES
ncbi:protein SCAR4-like isoform X2 [Phalaenopsis equestris]|uniref:protein SCAR4-like isoform X2 n=1 Tax=Phalaenopsis equestris TaxID=78828 RepID=UPI0009E49A75|nr:protein SCAR4-like isoform X2 [Phalaenopsis equestris]